MSPHLLGHLGVGVGPLASGVEAVLAEEAFTTGDREGHHDAVADLELGIAFADVDDLAHRLVAHHVPFFHARHDAVEQMQVRTADRAGSHLDDGVASMLDLGRLCRAR